ncbi:unnamed protein product [Protopolystoma xenopodis]|uniref:Uncharacterized protein n=1 Tax=Protopolystoma xenopodis TaxID=117903 RepID=A0A3S5AF79_9PLAT|nr:unnamed protein product [Protopolystoma xenopodis]
MLTIISSKELRPKVPTKYYALCAFTYVAAMLSSNASLRFVNYPTQIIGKSVKPIPIMLFNVLWAKRKFPLHKYLFVLMITAGVVLFLVKNPSSGSQFSFHIGEALLVLSLVFDGLTGGIQEDLRCRYVVGSYSLMLQMNIWSITYLSVAVLGTGEVSKFIDFVILYPEVIWNILLFSVASAIGQLCAINCILIAACKTISLSYSSQIKATQCILLEARKASEEIFSFLGTTSYLL